MKKLLIILAALVLLPVATASADEFHMGGSYNAIQITFNGQAETVGGGSYDGSTLNGAALPWVYCVDLLDSIYLNGEYDSTLVGKTGIVNGVALLNAGQIAWLLENYAGTASGSDAWEAALQAVIWQLIYGETFAFSTSNSGYEKFGEWLAAANGQYASPADLLWLTPHDDTGTVYQGLVTQQVPEPGSLLLVGAGLFGLAGTARRRFRKAR